jgi:hypothetical protein
MSTRCQIRVIEEDKEDNKKFSQDVLLYHHSDGYPQGNFGMLTHFYRAYLFGVTPKIKPWETDIPNAKPSDYDQWKAYRAGYAASYLCYVEPTGFNPESVELTDSEDFLHGDIAWYYKLYVKGKVVKGKKYPQWELEIYKVGFSNPQLVLKRTPLCQLVNNKGFLKKELEKVIELNVTKMNNSKSEREAIKAFKDSLRKMDETSMALS